MQNNSDRNLSDRSGHLICWRSVLTGVLVSLFVYMTLSSLGAAIGGFSAAHMFNKGDEGSGLYAAAGLWMGASAVVAVFLGAYFGTRYSDANHKHVGGSQGLVVAAIFFIIISSTFSFLPGSYAGVVTDMSGPGLLPDADAGAAKLVGEAGSLLFVTYILGLVAAIIGGVEGAHGNLRKPFTRTV